ncbi:MAG: hypothetical protein ACRDHN_12775, partial [Thermomicrobiales bacterium]
YSIYDSGDCTGSPVFTSSTNVVDGVPAAQSDVSQLSTVGVYNWLVTYSGDASNNPASSVCGSETFTQEKYSPTITTTVRTSPSNTVVPQNGVLSSPVTVYDSATLGNDGPPAGGEVTFRLYRSYNCDPSSLVFTSPPADPSPAMGAPFTVTLPGTYNWVATFSGDDLSNPATTQCGEEQFFVDQGVGGISTQTKRSSDNSNLPDDFANGIDFGTSVYDTTTLVGFTPSAGGTVIYNLYAGSACSGTPVFSSTKTVVNAVVPQSDPYNFPDQGTFNWQAVYSGDAQNQAATSPCGSETVLVFGKTVSIATTMNDVGDGSVIPDQGGVLIGSAVTDSSVITGGTADLSGTLTYNLYRNSNCTGTPAFISPRSFTDRTSLPASFPATIDQAAVYNWQVVYSGDANNRGATSACGTETLIGQTQPTIATTIKNAAGDSIENGHVFQLDELVKDSAVLTGATATAGGTVTYNLYYSNICAGTPKFSSAQNVANGIAPDSATFNPYFTGDFRWQAVYSGDQFNRPVTSDCADEFFSVAGNYSIEST